MKGNKEGFIASAKQLQFAKLLGLSKASAFRQPDSFDKKPEPKGGNKTVSGEGKFDLSKFNG
jgi:hypothetical protein